MKLVLIKPNIGRREHSLYVDEGRMEPLQLGILAALTPRDVEIVMYDDRMEEIPYDEGADLVAITVETFTARRGYEISKAYRERGIPTVMGGMHVMLLPEEVKNHADSIMIGDAENLWPQLIEDFKRGQLKKEYRGEQPLIPQKSIITRRDIFEGKGYLPITLLQFSRGCKYHCNFCASTAYFKGNHYCRDVQDVVREIKSQKRKLLFFVDDNIVADFEKAKALFTALIPLKVKWVSQGSMDMLEDQELMELMVKSGCLGLVIGFESINEENLEYAAKGANRKRALDHYKKEIQELRKWGLQTWAAFTLGYDGDTKESIIETCKFAIENKFCFAAFNILMPYPNTPLYAKLQEEGRLLYGGNWWLHEDYRFNHAAFIPQNLSPEDLTEVSFWCRRAFNSPWSIFKRALEPHTNLRNPYRFFTYLIYNPLFRKEVFKKQSMRFGLKEAEKING
ncbi:B12-binding domain-containing radical SAM protein [Alkaliphilus serpentinus]|uniref:B12-binding domain-containing radical SAM protein n=1 Tax=Alkaliphilus serpentinus TaxID=1482731 RepID=A0A833HP97_9FIRM|nr:radical SAM protein [Alkaliphilus serpentinus]KAB3530510.1 B12-binding domain-containing radical SAM protein [Alkaliphilus serpentinus]